MDQPKRKSSTVIKLRVKKIVEIVKNFEHNKLPRVNATLGVEKRNITKSKNISIICITIVVRLYSCFCFSLRLSEQEATAAVAIACSEALNFRNFINGIII